MLTFEERKALGVIPERIKSLVDICDACFLALPETMKHGTTHQQNELYTRFCDHLAMLVNYDKRFAQHRYNNLHAMHTIAGIPEDYKLHPKDQEFLNTYGLIINPILYPNGTK